MTTETRKRNRSRRGHTVAIRFSNEELCDLDIRCELAETTRSNLIREAFTRVNTWTMADKISVNTRTREIARIGNNLNQIARWCNIHKSAADSIEVVSHLQSILQEISELKND